MTNEINLSKRLKAMTTFVPKGAIFADIGSDHAYLPIVICQNDQTAQAIAGELNTGPYQAALKHVKVNQLTDQIEVIQGNGLDVIQNKAVDHVTIAGMGGGLIRSILERGKDNLVGVKRLILQPNTDSGYLREWLSERNYQLVDEVILEEDGHIYEIIVADQKDLSNSQALSEKDLLFGPLLRQNKDHVFIKKWQKERANYQHIIQEMNQAKEPNERKINRYIQILTWIEEVLADG